MPNLDNSLSSYTDPTYSPDYFPQRRKGKGIANYIYASIYNRIASGIIALQERILDNVSLTGSLDASLYINPYDSTSDIPLTKRVSGSVMGWQEFTSPSGQNGISLAYIESSQITDSSLTSAFFWGQAKLDSSGYKYYRIAWRDLYTRIGTPGGSVYVGNYSVSGQINPVFDTAGNSPTYQNLTTQIDGLSLPFAVNALKHTPFHSILLKNATNQDASPSGTINSSVDRYPSWDTSLESGYNTNYQDNQRTRVIIASSRGFNLGTQYLQNKQVYNPTSGEASQNVVPSGHTESGKTLLGPGALMINGSFFIPRVEDIRVPSRYSNYGLTNQAASNSFFCYPGLNSPVGHGIMAGSNNAIVSHVFIIGEAV